MADLPGPHRPKNTIKMIVVRADRENRIPK